MNHTNKKCKGKWGIEMRVNNEIRARMTEEEQKKIWIRYYEEPKPYSPQYVFRESHRTSGTYIRSHCIISWLIWWQRVRSIVFNLFGTVPDEAERLVAYFVLL